MTRKNETFDRDGNLISSIEVPYTQEELKAELNALAQQYEFSDDFTAQGLSFKITPESKTDLIGLFSAGLGGAIENGTVFSHNNGVGQITKKQAMDIGLAVLEHIQKVRAIKGTLKERIKDGTLTGDIHTVWKDIWYA